MDTQIFLKETNFLDFSNDRMDRFVASVDPNRSAREIAVEIYYLVRDSFVYNPYHLDIRAVSLKASKVLQKRSAWCVEKSSLMAALCRKFEIPSRLGYAIVKNHIGVEKMLEFLKKDEIVFHGYVEVFLDEKWVKCTPAFDARLCAVSGVEPLEWDGTSDAIFQAFQGENRFMEYTHFYGVFEDVPAHLMHTEMRKHYPHLFEKSYNTRGFSFLHD